MLKFIGFVVVMALAFAAGRWSVTNDVDVNTAKLGTIARGAGEALKEVPEAITVKGAEKKE